MSAEGFDTNNSTGGAAADFSDVIDASRSSFAFWDDSEVDGDWEGTPLT